MGTLDGGYVVVLRLETILFATSSAHCILASTVIDKADIDDSTPAEGSGSFNNFQIESNIC